VSENGNKTQEGLPFNRTLAWFGVLLGGVGLALAAAMIWDPATSGEAKKILLQFLLVTGLGGVIALFLNSLKDREAGRVAAAKQAEAERAAHVSALQAIDRELGSIYRSLKAVKRELRTRLLEADRDGKGRVAAPYVFPTEPFRKCMADLLAAQIKAEDLRDLIAARTDLFDAELFGEEGLRRMRNRLNYAARFFHDVFEDVERGKVKFEGEVCRAGVDCCNIDSLLNGRAFPQLPAAVHRALMEYLEAADDTSAEKRHELLDRIEEARSEDGEKRRFRAIADDSFALAAAEIRDVIGQMAVASGRGGIPIGERSYSIGVNRQLPSEETAD